MSGLPEIRTARLVLRDWRDSDLEPLAAMNGHPRVAEYLPAPLTRAESDALAARVRAAIAEHGIGPWVLEAPGRAPFVGFAGLARPRWQAHFTPCVEVAWRLAAAHWGRGYATEAARAALTYGLETLGLPEIVSFTVAANTRSWRVMVALGMARVPDGDFDHPRLPEGHALRRHILYRIDREGWLRHRATTVELVLATTPAQMELARAVLRDYEREVGVDLCFQGFAAELAGLPGAYASPGGRFLLAMRGDDAVGCVAVRALGDGVAEMKRLYVRPEAKGLGLGRRLALAILDAARELGHRRMRLDTLASMNAAIALYRSLGFREIAAYTDNPLPGTLFFEIDL